MTPRRKPQGSSGPITVGQHAEWKVVKFPDGKTARESLIARLFVEGFSPTGPTAGHVALESEPSLAPFGHLKQNDEKDLDFTVTTALGDKLMELAEFAPLAIHGPTFANAPRELHPSEKARLALQVVQQKSAHQGGSDRFLLLYATEHGFKFDPMTIELLRRSLASDPPNFDRVYYISIHDLESCSVCEIFPGSPHHFFEEWSDDQLSNAQVAIPHPLDMVTSTTTVMSSLLIFGRHPVQARLRVTFQAIGMPKSVT